MQRAQSVFYWISIMVLIQKQEMHFQQTMCVILFFRVASALHIAIRAIEGVKLGVPEIEKYPRKRKRIVHEYENSGLRKTASALGNSGTRWTKEEKAMLIALYEQEESYERIGKDLRRTPFEIQEKLEMMGYRGKKRD